MTRAVSDPIATSDAAVMSRRQLLAAYLADAHGELLNGIRSPQMIVFTILFPVMFYLLVGIVFGPFRHPDPQVRVLVLIGFIIMASMTSGLSAFAGTLATERETGLWTLRRALPMPNGSDVVAKTVTAVLCVAGIVPMLMAIGLSLGNVQLSLRSMIAIEALALGGALPFCGLGFLIGVYASARAVPAVVNVVMIPMLYLSGALFPLPQGLSWVSHLTPPFYLQQLMLAAAGSPSQFHPLIHAGVLFGIAVVSTALSLRRFAFVG